jgi:hypothetical protein
MASIKEIYSGLPVTEISRWPIPRVRGAGNSGSPENGLWRGADRFKPAADINLSMGLAAEMAGGGTIGGGQVPLDYRELLISALDHIPMNGIVTDDPADLALEFLQTGHAFSVERWLAHLV